MSLSHFVLAFAFIGCGVAQQQPADPVAPAASVQRAEGAPPAGPEDWRCGGELVPPAGYEHETVILSRTTANAEGVALERASLALRDRLCAGFACEKLQTFITAWKAGRNADSACAMAVIERSDLARWQRDVVSLAKLDDKLSDLGAEIVPASLKGLPVLGIDSIVDLNVAGGPRADWFKGYLERALQGHAELRALPREWAGDAPPRGFDAVVRAEIVARNEGQVASLDVSLWSLDKRGARRRSKVVTVPEVACPERDVIAAPAVARGTLAVRMDSEHNGGLCAGEATQVWLRSERSLHVRVVNLWGQDGGVLLYPGSGQRDLVEAGKTVPLGGERGFVAVPVPGSEFERYLAIGASVPSALGPLGKWTRSCRLPPALARELIAGRGLPTGVETGVTGYRLRKVEQCPGAPSEVERERLTAQLARLPWCEQ